MSHGRQVFAIPGEVNSRNSFGTIGLIKQGAKLVSCVGDILEELSLEMSENQEAKDLTLPDSKIGLGAGENRVYDLISAESTPIDEIIEKTNMDISRISAILLTLQMKKLIKQLPGKQFVRS